MPGREIGFIPDASRKAPPPPLTIMSPRVEGEDTGARKQFLAAAARAKRKLAHAAKEGRYIYLRAHFKVRMHVHQYAAKERTQRAEKADGIEKMEIDGSADDASSVCGAAADGRRGASSVSKPESDPESVTFVHVVGARNSSVTYSGNDNEGVGAYDVLLPPRMPWSEFFGIRTPSSSGSEVSVGPPTPSTSVFFPSTTSATVGQSRSQSFLGLRSTRSTSTDPTSRISGWTAVLPSRFASSSSNMADASLDASPPPGLPAMYAAREAERLEAREDEAAAQLREEKKRARDQAVLDMEAELKRKRKERARGERLKKARVSRGDAARLNTMGWFQLE